MVTINVFQNIMLQASVNVILFCFVLYTFYFHYVTYEEEKGIIGLLNDILGLTPNDGKDSTIEKILRTALKYVPKDKLDYVKKEAKKAEAKRAEKNNALKFKTMVAILILATVLIVINIVIAVISGKNYRVNVGLAIAENILFAIILLILRYAFFANVVTDWKRLSKEAMLYEIIKPYSPKPSNSKK